MKKIFILSIAMIFIIAGAAGQSLKVQGYVIEKQNSEIICVPFATVYYYNYDDTTKVEFVTITNLAGEYSLQNMRSGKYIAKITAPGYQPSRQEIMYNVERLAPLNNGRVWAIVEMSRANNVQITPSVYMLKDLIKSDDDTVEKIIENLKLTVQNNDASIRKNYRIWLGGNELDAELYNDLKVELVTKTASKKKDKSLSKSYIEYYELVNENKTFVDGIFNIVFNNKNKKCEKRRFEMYETTDFFIKK
jgi:hypothetical protein